MISIDLSLKEQKKKISVFTLSALQINVITSYSIHYTKLYDADFKESHPGVSFEIRIANSLTTVNLVKDHKLLLGVVGAKTATKNVNFQPFIGDELILVASSERKPPAKIKAVV